MEFKRWTSFAVLTASLSVQAYALGQELNGKPTVPADIGTVVVEEGDKAPEKPPGNATTPPPGFPDLIFSEGNGVRIRFVNTGTGTGVYVAEEVPGTGVNTGVADFDRDARFYIQQLPKFVIGIALAEVPESLRAHIKLAEGTGIMIGSVIPDSPAAKAGFQQYDVLLKAGDKELKQMKELQELVDATEAKPISITLQRAGEQKTIEVTPIKREELKVEANPLDSFLYYKATQKEQPLDARWIDALGRVAPTTGIWLTDTSALPVSAANPPPVEALTDSIRKLTEQIERLQQAVDRLEKKPEPKENENHGYRAKDRHPNQGDCLQSPRHNPLTTLISIS